ncbi:MAG: PhoH family protein [Phycisphaerales bacterium]
MDDTSAGVESLMDRTGSKGEVGSGGGGGGGSGNGKGKGGGGGGPGVRSGRSKKKVKSSALKTFVLDTNVLLHNPHALFVFEDNDIVIPFAVLEELDNFKGNLDDIGRNARESIRYLDALRTSGSLLEGVSLGNGEPALEAAKAYRPTGKVRIIIAPPDRPDAIKNDTPDNRIIGVANLLKSQFAASDRQVVFVSKDINARVKAEALGVHAEDFENQKIDPEELYTGYRRLVVPRELIDEMFREQMLEVRRLEEFLTGTNDAGETVRRELQPNEFAWLVDAENPSHTGIGRRLGTTDHVVPIGGSKRTVFGIVARNLQQQMALDLLMNNDVKLVTLIGTAGTGKTLLAVAAGMQQVFGSGHSGRGGQRDGGAEGLYDKMLVARPIVPLGRDIGYLPGDKDEKLTAWMQPIFDNLTYLLSNRAHGSNEPVSHTAEMQINKYMADGRLVLEPLTYIRGRSIPHQFMIVDEAQNLSPHEVKTIISRVGEGTKIVLTGDIEQIDNPYLDTSSNGLAYAVDRMKGADMVGHITLEKSERSSLASLAADRL